MVQQFGEDKMNILFGSKTRVKLLRLFLANPEESYYVRELTRLLEMQINSIRRELENLLRIGIIELNEQKNLEQDLDDIKSGKVIHNSIKGVERKYYKVNMGFLLYNELKFLFAKMKGITRETFVENLKGLGGINLLLLCGMFIDEKNSEVDMLIVGNPPKDHLQKVVNEYNESVSREVNFTLLSDEEFLYRQEVVDRFLYNILQNTNNMVFIDNRKDMQK